MSKTLIAVAVLKNGRISGHAGRTVGWHIYRTDGDEPQLVWTLQLSKAGNLHEWHQGSDDPRHPLYGVDVAIAASAGSGVTRRLAEHGTRLLTTIETDPLQAIRDYLAGNLQPAPVRASEDCCSH
ncbi:MAG: nitrogen fixation protein [Pseudomonadota bacterium]|nr:nitrogen fixation protein [Pseudomonadota bacterium]